MKYLISVKSVSRI